MGAVDEFKRLVGKAGAIPYRRVGKVRAAVDPRTPGPTLTAVLAAVKSFAQQLVDEWPEPDGQTAERWREKGFVPREVCDDPVPRGIDPNSCPVEWLVGRCSRYHFRLSLSAEGVLMADGADGFAYHTGVKPLLPAWYVEACNKRKPELAEYVGKSARVLAAVAQADRPENVVRPEQEPCQCELCKATVFSRPVPAALCDQRRCPFRGGKS